MMKRENIGRLMGCLHRHGRMYFDRKFSEWDIGSGSHPFLMILWHQDGLTQKELTEMLHLDKASTTRALARLTKLGYVIKKRDEKDHRAYRIHLTDKGRKILNQAMSVARELIDQIMSSIGQTDAVKLSQMLEVLRDNAYGGLEKVTKRYSQT